MNKLNTNKVIDKIKMLLPLSLMIGGFSAQSFFDVFKSQIFSCCMPTTEILREENNLQLTLKENEEDEKDEENKKDEEDEKDKEEVPIWLEVNESPQELFGENYRITASILFGKS